MGTELEILIPKRSVAVGGTTVEVRELAWPDALELFRRLGDHYGKVVAPNGTITLSAEVIGNVVAGADDLAGFLLAKSTDLDEATIRRLPASIATPLVAAALDLTLNQEVINAGKPIAERLSKAFGAKPSSASPSTS